MPRQCRLDLPGIAQHLVQRGNDRKACFFEHGDRIRYLEDLKIIARDAGCGIHAYVLMTNHAHLLLTPSEPGQVASVMQALGRRYVRYVNDRYHRTGTLWEGRYKACPVDSDDHLLRCHRYIELNPVRAALVDSAADYRWSSHAANALGAEDPLLTPHPTYLALGRNDASRQLAYRRMVAEDVPEGEVELIRQQLKRQHALGNERFRAALENRLDRRIGPARIGRPARSG